MKSLGLILFAAMHGYFAAWLAVWMLFRPRTPRYFWGYKVPFTPGLLPSSRQQLEISIADAVSKKLLVPEVLEKAAIQQGLHKAIRSSIPEHIEELAKDPEFLDALGKAVSEVVKDYFRANNGLKTELSQTAMVPFGKPFGINFDNLFSIFWKQVESAIERVCQSAKFRNAMHGAIRRIADDLRSDASPLSIQVENLAGKMVASAAGALDVRSIVLERLSTFTNEEIEDLVYATAGRHLQSIKNVAACLGILFGIFSALIFG